MKVAIVNPPPSRGMKFVREGRCEQRSSSFQYMMVPISLPSIAGMLLSKGYKVKIWDCIANDVSTESVNRFLIEYNPRLVIFNISTPTFNDDIEFIASLRKSLSCHFTAIGVHVSATAEETLSVSKLDSVIRREPELSSCALANAIKQNKSLSRVLGISFLLRGRITHNPDRPFAQNLDAWPFPARNLLNNQKYTLPVINQPYTLIISSRGCPNNCLFCTASLYYGSKMRFRSADNIMTELKEIVNKQEIKFVTMWSDTFTFNRKFVIEICKKIMESNLDFSWMCNSRVDKVDPAMLKLMRQAGCIGVSFGVESGNQSILDNVRKNITLKQIENAFKWTREAGIETLAHIIFGLPGETEKTIKKSVDFVIKLKPDYVQFYCAIPFPGTNLYSLAKKEGWLTTEDWSKFEINQAILNTPLLTVDQLREARIKAYRKFYLRPSYLVQRLKKIKSPRDFWLNLRQGLRFFEEWVLK